MAVELIYTSAPKTMDGPGYGVVAKSSNFPEPLERFIRQLNRYDFGMSTEHNSAESPVVFSHTTFADTSATWHVMSRVGLGGIDYSHRAVFLAHHIAVTDIELDGVPVAELIQAPTLFPSKWDGHVGLLPKRSLPVSRASRSRGTWGLLAGDHDWAKVWVDGWARHPSAASFVIVPGDSDVLALFGEALELLPPSDSCRVTFITLMIADRAGVHFDWIGLPSGSTLARSTLARFPERTLDLSTPVGRAPKVAVSIQRAGSTASRAMVATEGPEFALAEPKGDPEFGPSSPQRPRSTSRNRSHRAGAGRATAPPPPPPPALLRARYTTPLLILTGFALAVVAGGILWRAGLIGPGGGQVLVAQGNRAEPGVLEPSASAAAVIPRPQAAQAAQEPGGGPPAQQIPGPGGRGASDSQPPSEMEVVNLDGTSPKPRVVTVDGWIADKLTQEDPGAWVQVAAIDEREVPMLPMLTVLSSNGSGLGSTPLSNESRDRGVEIVLKDAAARGSPKLAFRLRKGADKRFVEVERPEKLSEDLLERLPFCVIQIVSDSEAASNRFPAVSILLAPELPGVPIDPEKWKIGTSLEESARAFFKKLHDLQKNVHVRIRIDRVTLSFLPADELGWRINSPVWDVVPGTPSTRVMSLTPPKGRLPVTLNVATHLNDNTLPPIEVKVSGPNPPAKPAPGDTGAGSIGPEVKLSGSGDADSGHAQDGVRTDSSGQKRQRQPQAPRQKNNRAPRKAEEPQPNAEFSPAQRPEKLDDTAFVIEMLRRYGRIHGSVVIRVQNGSSKDQEIEIVRFGAGQSAPLTQPH
jgi:hypothetical protein